jgi:hypothetical protein
VRGKNAHRRYTFHNAIVKCKKQAVSGIYASVRSLSAALRDLTHHHMSSKRRALIARYGEPVLQIRSEMREPLTFPMFRERQEEAKNLENKISDMGRK